MAEDHRIGNVGASPTGYDPMTVRGNSIVGNLGPTARSSLEGAVEDQRKIGVAEEVVRPHSCRTGALVGIARSCDLFLKLM